MQITIDNSEYELIYEADQYAVKLPDAVFRTGSLSQLLEELRKSYKDVALPEKHTMGDLTVAEELIKAGYKYLHVDRIFVNFQSAELTPSHWSPDLMKEATEEWQKSGCRFYEARWTDENGEELSQIFPEMTLEALGKVHRKPVE